MKNRIRGENQMASPLLAAILSFFIPGLGQFYTGQLIKAIVLFVAAVIFALLSTIIIGIPFYIIVLVYSIVDAYTAANKN
jgi:TM2 domain-containing membrane protein YozV